MRTVSVYPNCPYNEVGSLIFELRNGDVFVWNNCVMQVDDIWGSASASEYDSEMYSNHGGEMIGCSVKSIIRSSLPFFHRDSGLYSGKQIDFPLEFVAVAVNRHYIPPPPEPPPPPPPEPKTKFETLAGNESI